MPRAIYLSAGVVDEVGHYTNEARYFRDSFKSKGYDFLLVPHKTASETIKAEFEAIPLFSIEPEKMVSADPLIYWLESYDYIKYSYLNDLEQLPLINNEDILIVASAEPTLIWAVSEWYKKRFHADNGPHVFYYVNLFSGMTPKYQDDEIINFDIYHQPQILYRFAAKNIDEIYSKKYHFIASGKIHALAYSHLIAKKVTQIPFTLRMDDMKKDEVLEESINKSNIKIGFIGAQRPNKGFQHVPFLLELLHNSYAHVSFVIQNSWRSMPEQMQHIELLAQQTDRIQIIDDNLSSAQWLALHKEIDFFILPYDQNFYATAASGISIEAICLGTPQIAPKRTGISQMLAHYGISDSFFFEHSEPDTILETSKYAIEHFELLQEQTRIAHLAWHNENNSETLVSTIESMIHTPQP